MNRSFGLTYHHSRDCLLHGRCSTRWTSTARHCRRYMRCRARRVGRRCISLGRMLRTSPFPCIYISLPRTQSIVYRPPPTTPISNTLLIIRDESSRRFGVWLGGRIRQPTGDTVRRTERERFYGSGESFLWREVPNSPGVGNEHEGAVEVFKWTGMNEYVALCDEAFLSFGGGSVSLSFLKSFSDTDVPSLTVMERMVYT